MDILDEYLALESIGCIDLFDDLLEPADEGLGDTLSTFGKKILEVIKKLIQKIIDIYRSIAKIKHIAVDASVYEKIKGKISYTESIVNELDVPACYNKVENDSTSWLFNDREARLEDFRKIDSEIEGLLKTPIKSQRDLNIHVLKLVLSQCNNKLEIIKKFIKSNDNNSNINRMHQLNVSIITTGITIMNKIIYKGKTSNDKQHTNAITEENNDKNDKHPKENVSNKSQDRDQKLDDLIKKHNVGKSELQKAKDDLMESASNLRKTNPGLADDIINILNS